MCKTEQHKYLKMSSCGPKSKSWAPKSYEFSFFDKLMKVRPM